MFTSLTFIGFISFVAIYTYIRLRKEKLDSSEGYFLGGRSLTGIVIAGSMLLTNISTEHLIGMNGSSYKNGLIIIAWEVTSAIALVAAAIYFVPRYLKMGLTTIPEFLEKRFDKTTRLIVAFFLIVSFVITLLPIVLYTGAINLESIFNVSEILGVSQNKGLWITVVIIGVIGSIYAIFGGLKAVAISDTINGYGLLIGGLAIPILALIAIGENSFFNGFNRVYENNPEKFNVIGSKKSVLPFEVLFTGLIINQLYFWAMNQTIIQRALGAKNLIELSLKKNNQKTKVSIEEMVNKFLLVYKKNCTKKTKLFPNVVSVLKELKKNFQLILVSNKPEYFVKKILKYFNIFDLFNAVSGGDTFEFKKPDPKHLLLTLKSTGCNIADCVLVGDSMTDVECAKNAKIPIVLTSFGYNNEGYKNLSIDYLINNLNEIPIILKYLSK